MSKRIESGIVVAMAALTILSTTTVIHDQNAGKSDAVTQWMSGTFRKVESWVHSRAVTTTVKNVPTTAGASSQKSTGADGSPQSSTTTNAFPAIPTTSRPGPSDSVARPEPKTTALFPNDRIQNATGQLGAKLQAEGWSTADIQSLTQIVTRLVTSMNPTDWNTVEQALSPSEPTTQAEQQLITLLNSHLSPADKQWLLMHFQGNMAFSKVDVQLLKEAFAELQGDMTQGEQQLLSAQVSQLLVSGGAAGK